MTESPVLLSPVVSTQWLADHIGSSTLAIVDATVLVATLADGSSGYVTGHELYLVDGHLPGAIFADLVEELSDPTGNHPFTKPSTAQFEAAVSALGIDNDTTVVVYDRALGQWASRLWWLFRTNGYDRVAVLDGGQKKWVAEERPTDIGHVTPVPAVFTASPRPELWADKDRIHGVLAGDEEATLICAVSPQEFAGIEGSRARRGHIPGSLNIPVSKVVDVRGGNNLLPEATLRQHFAGVLGTGTIIAYCAGGIAATADALALTLLGEKDVVVYDGSLNEWSADADAPLAVVSA